jgi:hypothetical protein
MKLTKIIYSQKLSKKHLFLFILAEIVLSALLIILLKNRLTTVTLNLNYKFQREYRDGAIIDVANEFKNFRNPYSFDQGLPHTYTYGLIPPLITGLIGRLTKQSLVDVQLTSSFVLILLASLLIGIFSWKKTKNLALTILGLATPLVFSNITFRPEIYAIFITILVLIIAQDKNQNQIVGILLGIVSIFLYYIKPYFVLLWIVLFLYYLILEKSKKFMWIFVIFSGFTMLISYELINRFFPLYFPHTFINHINLYNNHLFSYMIKQSIDFFKENWSICLGFLFYTIYSFIYHLHSLKNVFFIYIIVSLFSLIFIGQHVNTYLTYYNQLLQIPIILFIIWQFKTPKANLLKFSKYFFITAFLINYQYFVWYKAGMEFIDSESWYEAINYIQQNNPQTAYLSPHFTSLAIENSWPIYDNGQTEYFPEGQILENNPKIFKDIFPQALFIEPVFNNWQNNLNKMVKNKYFSLIALPQEQSFLIDKINLNNNYYIDNTIDLPINLENIQFWKPI